MRNGGSFITHILYFHAKPNRMSVKSVISEMDLETIRHVYYLDAYRKAERMERKQMRSCLVVCRIENIYTYR